VDGTQAFNDTTRFKTARGGAAWSVSGSWPGGPMSSRVPRAKPNSEVGAALTGTAYLVRSQPEFVNSLEVHPGHELQMMIVTQGVPAYFRDNDVLHSASGTGEGFTAVDRFRLLGRPLEKRRGKVNVSILPSEEPLFVNSIFDNPLLFGSSDVSLTSVKQETLPVSSDGQVLFSLSKQPVEPTTVIAWLAGWLEGLFGPSCRPIPITWGQSSKCLPTKSSTRSSALLWSVANTVSWTATFTFHANRFGGWQGPGNRPAPVLSCSAMDILLILLRPMAISGLIRVR
jgi:hypothetical protein